MRSQTIAAGVAAAGLTLSDAAALSLDLRECRDHLCMVLGSFASATRMARHCRRGPL